MYNACMRKNTRMLNGYRVVYKPDHPTAMKSDNWKGYVYEHIYVAEITLGRSLTDEEEVHHLNGCRDDNVATNLLVLLKSQHCKLHSWLRSGAPGIERLMENGENSWKTKARPPRFCKLCGLVLQKKCKKFCSSSCAKFVSRKVARPTAEQLIEDRKSLSITRIGAKYGVSDNAIRKWAKQYGLDRSIMSRVRGTPRKGAETSGDVKSS